MPENLKRVTVATFYAPKYEYDEQKCMAFIDESIKKYAPYREFSYSEKRMNIPLANHIAWSLHDGKRLLGTEHRHKPDQVHIISENFSSNGFAKTKINAGIWTLTASLNSVVTDYIDIDIEVNGYIDEGDYSIEDYPKESYCTNDSKENAITWQRVEMHCHTVASDGDMQPKELVQNAIQRGYKGICVVDHNTTSNVDEVKKYGEKYGLVVAGGIEWTTFWGHLTVIGGNSKINWLDINPKNINACIVEARQSGDIVTLAHPKRMGWPFCAGCYNDFDITNWDYLTSYEVWSHYNPNTSQSDLLAKKEWISLLEKGYKLSALYGYDWHAPDEGGPIYAYTYLGIYGKLSEQSIMNAVEYGRTCISMGYKVEVSLHREDKTYTLGDEIGFGNYSLRIKYEKQSDYPYDVQLDKIAVLGNAIKECDFVCDGQSGEVIHDIYITQKGYFRIEGLGLTQGEKSDIFLTSPVYVKEI